jgi:hypothetical protein
MRSIFALALLVIASDTAYAQGHCGATNSYGNQRCEITCPTGEQALCADATASGRPICECKKQ